MGVAKRSPLQRRENTNDSPSSVAIGRDARQRTILELVEIRGRSSDR